MKKAWFIFVAIVIALGAVAAFMGGNEPDAVPEPENLVPDLAGEPVGGAGDLAGAVEVPEGIAVEPIVFHTIRVTAAGFEPASLAIKRGESVTWVNEASRLAWPASAVHPTHRAYPGSDIAKCGTAEAASIFDACGGIAPGGSWSFVFDNAGTWKYHDHLRASVTGSVTVE